MLVLTEALTLSPRSTAFFASNPAATMTLGFDVLVHDVIAAITTAPCAIDSWWLLTATVAEFRSSASARP